MRDASFPPLAVVDGHNQALFHWLRAKHEYPLVAPAILAHIDAHADMDPSAPTEEKAIRDFPWLNIKRISDYNYADGCLSVANHQCVAAHQGAIDSICWFDPRRDYVAVYGSESGLKTKIVDERIQWEEGCRISCNQTVDNALEQIIASGKPIILDIDLDAFLCVNDPDSLHNDASIVRHAKLIKNVIVSIPKERVYIITIAQSLNPSQWTPRDKAGAFLTFTMEFLREAGLTAPQQKIGFSRPKFKVDIKELTLKS